MGVAFGAIILLGLLAFLLLRSKRRKEFARDVGGEAEGGGNSAPEVMVGGTEVFGNDIQSMPAGKNYTYCTLLSKR